MVVAGFAASVSAQAGVNLLVNGSFEQPALAGAVQSFSNGQAVGPGWFKLSGALTSTLLSGAQPGYLAAQDGDQRIEVGTVYTSGFYQEVTLTAGTNYLLSFFQSGFNGDDSLVDAGVFGSNGRSLAANHVNDFSWTQHTLEFTPVSTGSYFVIFSAGVTSSAGAAVVDNVSLVELTEVPEPSAAAAIAGAGALGLVLGRRSRRRSV